jgi:hypothetical protein
VDEKGQFHVITYGLRQLRDLKLKLSLLGGNGGCKLGHGITLYTDHKPLEKFSSHKIDEQIAKNMLIYDFQIHYKKEQLCQPIFCQEMLLKDSKTFSTALTLLVHIYKNLRSQRNNSSKSQRLTKRWKMAPEHFQSRDQTTCATY